MKDKSKVTKTFAVRPLHDVFKMIDMRGGDRLQCWPWQGFMQPNHRGDKYPIFCWNKRRLYAYKVVYGLKNGMHYDDVPHIIRTCGSDSCCNPDHLMERWSVHAKIKAA